MEAFRKRALSSFHSLEEDLRSTGRFSTPLHVHHAASVLFLRRLFHALSGGTLSFLPDIELPDAPSGRFAQECLSLVGEPPYTAEQSRLPGTVYEALLSGRPGGRKSRGSFYTPHHVVRRVVERTLSPSLESGGPLQVLDPAVGSGFFLLAAAEFLGPEGTVYGMDLDPVAAEVARQALRLMAGDPGLEVHVKTGDALFSSLEEWAGAFPEVFEEQGGFSAVIGNPPFGDLLSREAKETLIRSGYPPVGGRAEISAQFIHRGLELLEAGGRLGYILPNTLLDGHQFGALRRSITRRAEVVSVLDYQNERVFPDAEVYGMILHLRAGESLKRYEARYRIPEGPQERLRVESGSSKPWRKVIPFVERLKKQGFVEPLSPGVALCRDAGLDYKYKSVGWGERGKRPSLGKKLVYKGTRRDAEDKRFLRGRHITPFRIAESDEYLIHDWAKLRTPDTAVLVYPEVTESEVKIVTRQTSDRLVAAIDREKRYTAKSVHTLVVNHRDYAPEFVCALLNSRVMNRIYAALTNETGRTFAQVKVSDLRELPVRRVASIKRGAAHPEWIENREAVAAWIEATEVKPLTDFIETCSAVDLAQPLAVEMVRSGKRSLLPALDRLFDRLYGV